MNTQISPTLALYIGYSVGAVALVALAAISPRVATLAVIVLIAAVVLSHGQQVNGALAQATSALGTYTNHPTTQGA